MVKPMSSTVNTLGSAFSQVLVASKDEAKEAMRQGFFDYLSGGGFAKSDNGSARWHEPATTLPHPPTFFHEPILCWLFALSLPFSSSHLAQPQTLWVRNPLDTSF